MNNQTDRQSDTHTHTHTPGLYEVLCKVSGLQSKDVFLLGIVGRLGRQCVLQVDRVGTECGALVTVLISVQVECCVA